MGIPLAALLACIVTASDTNTVAALELAGRIPILGGLLERSCSPTSAKAPPEAVDMESIDSLIAGGVLSDHPCSWFVARAR